jgi:hypothetical protein
MDTETITTDENKPKKVPGTGRGTGRKLGSKNVLAPEAKQSMSQFFESLTAENYRWRLRVKRILDGGGTLQDFHKWSLIALDRTLGTPAKHQVAGEQRDQLLFITTHGYVPWDARAPAAAALNARSVRLIEGKAEEIKLQAETREAEAAEKPVVIDATKGDSEEPVETLESVNLPENPDAFGGGGRGR